ncbi:hypothetical protein TNIN_12101 [Trichonephila inaurata madagascariensis]|uniref:Uncharacterized protein n=1 Tax=Trichonephila inaurata madagascariensis TaxID=2747483 RepID=A0A8X6X8T2_9ARAC|nr:hypothetical protein TNIN_12101 [Trichonephila inaurata madagascariensis]
MDMSATKTDVASTLPDLALAPKPQITHHRKRRKESKARHGFSYPRHSGEKTTPHRPQPLRQPNTFLTPIAQGGIGGDGRGIFIRREQLGDQNTKAATPVVAVSARDSAKSDGNLTDTEDEEFTLVSRKKKIASIVIDASQNTTGLLNTLSSHLGSTLEGRFENGKLRVFPKTIIEHRKLQSYLQAKKMRSHTFEMADNKQLKAVIRGLPTDFDQKEICDRTPRVLIRSQPHFPF